jgi:competence protein ComEC
METEKNFFEILGVSFAEYKKGWITFLFLSFLFVFLSGISFLTKTNNTRIYFLSVGQGDSELIETNGIKILIDGGPPNGRVTEELGKILSFWDKRIDVVILTHPELDHFGGLQEILEQFNVGTFVSTGDVGDDDKFQNIITVLSTRGITTTTLFAGDRISIRNSVLSVLSPKEGIVCKATNECALVLLFSSENKSALFTADIAVAQEKELTPFLSSVAVLKIAHHGSRYSTGESFLLKTNPKIAFIEVGKNSFGHPSPEILERLKKFNIPVFRTDEKGTMGVDFGTPGLRVFSLE